jgi:hypothetical protein
LKIPLALFLIMRNRWPAGVTFVHAAGKATRGEGAAVPLFWRDRGPGGGRWMSGRCWPKRASRLDSGSSPE